MECPSVCSPYRHDDMNAMKFDTEHSQRGQRIATTVFAFAFAAFILACAIFAGNNWAISETEYGFPLTFFRVYGPGPAFPFLSAFGHSSTARQFFMPALIFDVAFAAFATASAAFSIYRWSATWDRRAYLAFYAVCGLIVAPWFVSLPTPIAFEFLIVDLLGLTLLFVWFAVFTVWSSATHWWGKRAGAIALPLIACSMVGIGYWTSPHDAYTDPGLADIPTLLENRSSSNPRVRLLAVRALGRLKVEDVPVVDALVAALADTNFAIRMEAMSAIPRFGTKSARAVPLLLKLLPSKNDSFLAAGTLGEIGPQARAAVPALRAALPTATGYDKLEITKALWTIDGDRTLVIPRLIELLHDHFGPIRCDAARILGRIGPPAKAALPTLLEMIRHVPEPTRPKLSESNGPAEHSPASADSPPSVATLRPMTEAEFYPQIRAAATEALQKIDPGVTAALRDAKRISE
jgi:HEAT repeat protein